jgi:hypothetical protein
MAARDGHGLLADESSRQGGRRSQGLKPRAGRPAATRSACADCAVPRQAMRFPSSSGLFVVSGSGLPLEGHQIIDTTNLPDRLTTNDWPSRAPHRPRLCPRLAPSPPLKSPTAVGDLGGHPLAQPPLFALPYRRRNRTYYARLTVSVRAIYSCARAATIGAARRTGRPRHLSLRGELGYECGRVGRAGCNRGPRVVPPGDRRLTVTAICPCRSC